MQQLFKTAISFSRNKLFQNGGKIAMVATMFIVSGFFINNIVSASGGIITVTASNPTVLVSADAVSGASVAVGTITMAENNPGEFQAGRVTLAPPAGFQFDSSSIAHVVINGDTTAGNNINNATNGTSFLATTTGSLITFNIAYASVNDAGALIWSNIKIKPLAGAPLASGSIVIGGSPAVDYINNNPIILTEVAGLPSTANSAFSCLPSLQPVGGVVTCNVQVKDQFGNALNNASVLLSSSGSGNTSSTNPTFTDSNGNATITLSSGIAETKTIKITINGSVDLPSKTVTFYSSIPTQANIVASPKPQEASLAGSAVTLTIAISDQQGNPVNDGVDVTVSGISTSSGTILITGSEKTRSGQVTRTLNFNNKGDVSLVVNTYTGNLVLSGDTVVHFIDTTVPEITISGVTPVEVEYRTAYTDDGATASDNIDGDISEHIISTTDGLDTSVINLSAPFTDKIVATYHVNYNVADSSGNNAVQKVRTVNVKDTTAPEIVSLSSDATTGKLMKIGDAIHFTLTPNTAEPIATVAGSYNGQTLAWATTDSGVTYTATYTVKEGETDQIDVLQLSGVIMTDEAGNASAPFDGSDVTNTIDGNTPVAPVVSLPGYVNIANKAAVDLSVVGEVGTTVNYTIADGDGATADITGTGVVAEDGIFAVTLDLSDLTDGNLVATATLSDTAGNISVNGTDSAIKDTVAPNAPSPILPAYINTNNQATLNVTGTGERDALIAYEFSDATGSIFGTSTVDATGNIDFTAYDLSALTDGVVTLTMNLTDAAGNTGLEGSTISTKETIKPLLNSLTLNDLTIDGQRLKVGTYALTATFDDAVTSPKIAIAYSGTTGTCTDISATAMTVSADAKVFTYDLTVIDACDGALATATVSDASDVSGNIIDADSTHTLIIDTLAPVFSATTPVTDAFIKADFSVGYTLSEGLASGSIIFSSSTDSTYTLSASELTAGVHVITQVILATAGVALNEGAHTIDFRGIDLAGNSATYTNTGIIYDVTNPTILNVTSDKADGAYKAGENIMIAVEFSEPVNVATYYKGAGCGMWYGSGCWDTIDQRPYLTLETGEIDRNADYDGGISSTTIKFSYTVQAGDNSLDLDAIVVNALGLDGQSIRDFAGNDANLTLPAPGAVNSLSNNKDIKIDAVAPVIASHEEVVAEATSPSGAIVEYTSPVANDVFDGAVIVSCTPVSGSQFALDNNTVTCTTSDALGNTSVSTFNVKVVDTTKPTIAAPADINQPANGDLSTVVLGTPVVFDAVDTDLAVTNNAPSTFPIGTTVVTWTATDDYDNFETATQNVTIVPAPIAKLTVSAIMPVDTNSSSVVTVSGRDEWNHLTTNQSGTTVVVYADNGGGVDDSILTLVNGEATTNLRKSTAGVTRVTVSSGSLLPGTFAVTFTPADISGPSVLTMSPANDATNVAISAPIFFNFSEALNADTANGTNIQLMKVGVESADAQVAGMVLIEGNQKVYFMPAANLDYSSSYYFVVSGVADKAGNVMTTGIDASNSGFTTEANSAHLGAPVVEGQSPLATATGVALNAHPYVDFSEAMKATTMTTANIELRKVSDNSVVPASVSVENGGTRAVINPTSNLELETAYYIYVSGDVADEFGNIMGTPYSSGNFTTIADNTTLVITGISTVKSSATADNSWANGWSWQFDVTAPSNETNLKMKFADFVSGSNVIPAASNIRFYSAQSSNANSGDNAIVIDSANTYSAGTMLLSGDDNLDVLGRQIKIIVEVRVPVGTAGGSYSTGYGVETTPNEL